MDPRYSLVGLLVGVLIGLTGMGGGSLMTPVLILLLGFKPHLAIGSDMVYSAVTKIVGGYQHHRQKTVDYALSWRLALGSVPGGLLGVYWVHSLQLKLGKESEHLLLRMLGVMLIIVAAALLIKSSKRAASVRIQFRVSSDRARTVWAVAAGLAVGFLVGITSVGSGSIFGVLLLIVFGLGAQEMVGTDVFHAAILTTAIASGQMMARNVDYGLVANLLVGSIPGVLLGSRLAVKLPEGALRPVLASVLLVSGLKMI